MNTVKGGGGDPSAAIQTKYVTKGDVCTQAICEHSFDRTMCQVKSQDYCGSGHGGCATMGGPGC